MSARGQDACGCLPWGVAEDWRSPLPPPARMLGCFWRVCLSSCVGGSRCSRCAAKCRHSAEPSNAGIPPPKGRHARHSTPLFLGGDEVVAIWWTWSPMPRRHAVGCHFGPQHAGRLVHVDHVHTRDAVAPRLGSLAGVQSQAALSMDSGANCHSWSASLHVCKAQDKIASMHQVLGLRSHRIRSACPPARSCRHRARSATLGQKPMARRDGKVSHWLRQIRAARLLVTVRLARDAVH